MKSLYKKLKYQVAKWLFRKIDLKIYRFGPRLEIHIWMLTYGESHAVDLNRPYKPQPPIFDLKKRRMTMPVTKINPEETEIRVPGVYRCCLVSLKKQIWELDQCEPGDTLNCEHCEEEFQLTKAGVWVPVWQLEKE